MEVRAGYKLTEVGVIPEDWDMKPLGAFVSYTNGKAHEQSISDYGPFVVVNSKFISTEGLTRKYSQHCYCPASAGDVLMVMSDVPNGRAIAKCYFVESNNTYTVNQRICILNPREIDGKLLFYKLDRNPFYLSFDDGAKQTNLRKDDVLACPLGVPTSEAEQRAIAAALSDVDALLDGLERLIAKKRDLKQAAMQQLLTGQTRLPGFSGEWEVKRLGELVDCAPSGTYGLERQAPHLFPMPVATTAQISNDDRWNGKTMQTRFFTAEQVATFGVSVGDLVVVKSSGSAASIQSGKMVLIDCSLAKAFLFSNFLMRLRPVAIFPKFLYFFLTSSRIKILLPSLCEASTYPNIRINEYLQIDIPVPETSEQTAIAAVLSDMDAELAALEARRDKTRALKQAMMQELLTGRIRLI